MRVRMLASSYPRFPGDASGLFIQALARGLTGLGHAVQVIVPSDPRAEHGDAGPVSVRRFAYSPFPGLQPMGYGKALENDRRLRWGAWACAVPYFISAAACTAAHGRAWDVLHAHWVLPNGPAGAVAAALSGRPLVVTLHGSDVFLALASAALRPVAVWTLRRSAAVTACSPAHIEAARRLGVQSARLHLVPWGGDSGRFACADPAPWRARLRLTPGAPVLLALGRLVEKKGFQVLLAAFERLLCAGCRATTPLLVIAGDGVMRTGLEREAARRGILASVRFAGEVPPEDVPGLMAAADVVAIPSIRDGSGNEDGLPTVALEAMAAGKPVVASALGGLPLVVEHGVTGLLTGPGDADGLALALGHMLGAPAWLLAMGAAGRARVEGPLGWQAIARRYAQIYREVTRRS